MHIEEIMAGLAGAADAEGVAAVVVALGRDQFGLRQCGVSWHRTPSDMAAWWVLEGVTFEKLYAEMRGHHAPVGQSPASDRTYTLLLPVIEPAGLLGAICCAQDVPFDADKRRDLTTLAAHVSVRLAQLGVRAANEDAVRRLTPRQTDVALLAARGLPNAGIASELRLSENTVKKHLKDIFDELGVRNRTELAVRLGSVAATQVSVLRLASER